MPNLNIDDVKLAARGFYKHAVRGEYDPEGVQGMLRLMVKTNGGAADAVNLVHRAITPKYRFGDTVGATGPLSRERRRSIVNALREDGFYIFPERIPDAILDPITKMMNETPGLLYPAPENGPAKAIHDPQSPQAPAYYYREAFPPAAQRMMIDENFTAIATDYLGVDPILHTFQQWTSVATDKPVSPLAQLFHYDVSNLKWLNIFVYLTDVTPDSGPHCVVRGSHRYKDKIGAPLRARGATRFSDEEIIAAYGPERQVEVTGARGTVLCVDTRTCHKGKHPTAADRRIMSNYYVNSSFGIPGECHTVANPIPELLNAAKKWPRLLHYYPLA